MAPPATSVASHFRLYPMYPTQHILVGVSAGVTRHVYIAHGDLLATRGSVAPLRFVQGHFIFAPAGD